jgi:hypothetical protein
MSMFPELTPVQIDASDADPVLLCPNCGGRHLRFVCVGTAWRNQEDGTPIHTVVGSEGTSTYVGQDIACGRRSMANVTFACEECDSRHEIDRSLTLYEHEGEMRIGWVKDDEWMDWPG